MATQDPGTQPEYSLLANNRFWLLCAGGLLAVVVGAMVWTLVPAGELRIIRLQQAYGIIGMIYLYLALLATPLTKVFPDIPGKQSYLFLRRAIGVSAFGFSLLHVLIAFFGQLGGFSGLGFLSSRYMLALALGALGLAVLGAMAATSFDKVIDRMGFRRWKKLHQLVYLAGLAILVHVVMLGTHYAYGSSIFTRVTLAALLVLLLLEAVRADSWLKRRIPAMRRLGAASVILLHVAFLGIGIFLGKNAADPVSLQVHGGHDQSSAPGQEKAYVSFAATTTADDQTIRITRQQVDFQKLIAGGEVVEFVAKPGFTDVKSVSCFLVSQQSYEYYQGLAKVQDKLIRCLPIGDDGPPEPGHYTLYLRIERPGSISTVPFNLEVTGGN